MICHDTPNRSLSQPHCCAFSSPPYLQALNPESRMHFYECIFLNVDKMSWKGTK